VRRPLPLLAALVLHALPGCLTPCPEESVSREQLVGEYNANAAAVPRLWARAQLDITIPTDSALPVSFQADGLILLGKRPGQQTHDFVLVGRKAGQEVFRTGCSASQDKYYFWYRLGEHARAYWGRNELAGAEGIDVLPIDPHDLLDVLAVCELPSRFTDIPTAVLTMEDTPGSCAYDLTLIERQPDTSRLVPTRRILFTWQRNRQRRPFRVEFLDADGRMVLSARLEDYRPISGGPPPRPVMPTDIRIDWPQRESKLRIRLTEMTTEPRGDPAAAARFRPPVPPNRIVQVDAHIQPKDSCR